MLDAVGWLWTGSGCGWKGGFGIGDVFEQALLNMVGWLLVVVLVFGQGGVVEVGWIQWLSGNIVMGWPGRLVVVVVGHR